MRQIHRLSILFVYLLACACSPQKAATNYQLVWSDEFDYTGLPDSQKWSFDTEGNAHGWGNNEQQHYTSDSLKNAEVKNGKLYITALMEKAGGKAYTSARLKTKGKGDWLYGKFEIRAKLPEGRGLWPALWMLPSNWEYGSWPGSGEIDIMENVGYMPDTILCTVHTKSYNHSINTQKSDSMVLTDCYTNFHVYQLEWGPSEMRMLVDDQLVFTFKNEETTSNEWPFDKQFHLLLNVAVGGNWGGMKGIDDSIFPQSMEVDYVRVYQKKN
ncbi:glycoside hydrolase family 16 protein [Mangrovibacterium lignilyticum]|uniref:glycoside hydrolase family 16 protein n=1 Tax=Mangrovibacterium lignilyticum TaxID=2668052 RepID=UPI0013D7336B|nr:glycoside hydrolase family 16 protein [Mangrovibacterium lignilyticum]